MAHIFCTKWFLIKRVSNRWDKKVSLSRCPFVPGQKQQQQKSRDVTTWLSKKMSEKVKNWQFFIFFSKIVFLPAKIRSVPRPVPDFDRLPRPVPWQDFELVPGQ